MCRSLSRPWLNQTGPASSWTRSSSGITCGIPGDQDKVVTVEPATLWMDAPTIANLAKQASGRRTGDGRGAVDGNVTQTTRPAHLKFSGILFPSPLRSSRRIAGGDRP
jgi:hypothetical protein